MIYFKMNGNLIEKYQVSFDDEKILQIINAIEENCTSYKHRNIRTDKGLGLEGKKVKNFTMKKVGTVSYHWEVEDVYQYEYDESISPKLADILKGIRAHRLDSFEEFFSYNPNKDTTLDSEIVALNKKVCDPAINSIDEKKKILEKLDYLLQMKKERGDSKSISDYYNEAYGLIKVEFISSLDISVLENAEQFIGSEVKINNFVRTKNNGAKRN